MNYANVSRPLVSVVVIGRNEGERLRRCLESVGAIDLAPASFEVLYVDSGSMDDSAAIASTFGARVFVLDRGPYSAARARNVGWQAARAPYVLFLDGDTVVDARFPERALADLQHDGVAVVWGHRRESRPRASLYNRVLDLDWVYPAGDAEFCGGDAMFRRAALELVGGFDPSLIAGEEPELCARLRQHALRIVHIDAPMTRHDLAITRPHQYWTRARRAGYAYAQVAERTRDREVPLWRNEVRGNRRQILFWLLVALSSVALAIVAQRPAALLLAPLALVVMSLRSAWRARWRGASAGTLLLYGLHSHVQQLPIAIGQLAFHMDRRRGRRRELIEYHQPVGQDA